jgi:hypothetical protein
VKALGLRELTDEFGVEAVARRMPTTWAEAVAAYASDRRDRLKEDWSTVSEFDAEKRRLEHAAVGMIEKRLIADVTPGATLKIPAESERETMQKKLDLASLLCPNGWETLYAPVLQKLASEVEASWLKGEEIKSSQAVTREIEEFKRFLLKTKAAGDRAAIDQQRTPRAGGARDPRAKGGVRSVM